MLLQRFQKQSNNLKATGGARVSRLIDHRVLIGKVIYVSCWNGLTTIRCFVTGEQSREVAPALTDVCQFSTSANNSGIKSSDVATIEGIKALLDYDHMEPTGKSMHFLLLFTLPGL